MATGNEDIYLGDFDLTFEDLEPLSRSQSRVAADVVNEPFEDRITLDELFEIEFEMPSTPFTTEQPPNLISSTSSVPAIIDLTGEPDSPPRNNGRASTTSSHQPRDQAETRTASGAPFIDLTGDTESQSSNSRNTPAFQTSNRTLAGAPSAVRRIGHEVVWNIIHRLAAGDYLSAIELHNYREQPADLEIIGENRPRPMDFSVLSSASTADSRNRNKHTYHPTPPPRPGFSRETNDEDVVVCAGCDQELEYNPDAEYTQQESKKRRTKKDTAEHHVWAVKKCGHVYCRNCYDSRSFKKQSHTTHFRYEPPRKVLCAVEGCDVDVTSKTSWVGLFL